MSEPFEIDTDALGRAEAPFRELSGQLSALSDQVQERVRSLGAVWGDDESGNQFVAQYGPARDQLLEGFRSTSDVVHSTADGVRTMSQGFGRTEDSNREANEGLLGRVRGSELDAPVAPASAPASAPDATPTHLTPRLRATVAATPTHSFLARADAVQGTAPLEPTQYTPARVDRAVPTEPTEYTPARADRVLPVEPTQYVAARADRAVPARFDALESTRRVEPVEPAVPAEPARFDAVRTSQPLEPVRRGREIED